MEHEAETRAVDAAFDAMPVGGVVLGTDGRVLRVNRRLEVQLDARRAELLGAPARAVLGTDAAGQALAVIEAGLAGERASSEVFWPGTPERHPGVVLRAVPERDASGALTSVTLLAEDLRGSTEDELRARDQELEAVQRVARIGSYRTDLRKGTWTASDGFCALFDFEPGGVYTMKAFEELVHPDDHARVMAEFGACLAERRPFDVDYRCVVGPDQRVIHVRSTSHVVYDESGQPVRIIGIKQDISERVEMQSQVVALQRIDAIGRVAGGVAHDFNNLLTAIQGFAEVALLRMEPEDVNRQALAQILQAGDRAARLTRQLLAFSRKQVVAPRLLAPGAICQEAVPMLRRLLGDAVELKLHVEKGLWRVTLDQTVLEQILVNLCVNARDAMPDGGSVVVELRNRPIEAGPAQGFGLDLPPGAYVCLSVSDTGVGMDAETQRHIFEPFFTTKPVGQGTGLGLSTCYGLVEQAGGRILVYSEPGVGSTFRVFLPRTTDPGEARTQTPEAPAGALQGGSGRILLAEDDPRVRELAVEVLSAAGYSVTAAPDGETALRAFRASNGAFDLLLSDVVMPGMSGVELVDTVRERAPGLPALLISGFPSAAIADRRADAPQVELLQKPFALHKLLERVRALLEAAG